MAPALPHSADNRSESAHFPSADNPFPAPGDLASVCYNCFLP